MVSAPSFIRGDSYPFKVKVIHKDDQTPILESEVESIFITFKQNTSSNSKIIFQKKLEDVTIDEDGYCHIVFNPSDTETLPYGTYYFDIEITLTNGYRKTQIYSIAIKEETTNHGV